MDHFRKGKKLYILQEVTKRVGVEVSSGQVTWMPLTWLTGQVGACPVFTSRAKALKAASRKNSEVWEVYVNNDD